jgi:hypothetical protein
MTRESYGTLPCNECMTGQSICLISGRDTTKGLCSCMLQKASIQSCTGDNAGLRVNPDASQLCSISLDFRRMSTSSQVSADWGSLAVGPCILISMANSYCYNVPGYGYLIVGLGAIQTSSLSRRMRMLLSLDSGNDLVSQVDALGSWNETSQPCQSLAKSAGNITSVLDIESLKSCIHWRRAGYHAIERLNLTSLSVSRGDDAFLMTWMDFVRIVGTRKGAVAQIASSLPQLMVLVVDESGLKSMIKKISNAIYHSVLVKAWPLLLLQKNATHAPLKINLTEEMVQMDELHAFVLSQHRTLSIFQVLIQISHHMPAILLI